MTLSLLKLFASVLATGLGALAIAACGGDELPDDAVAKVGDAAIPRADYDKWYRLVVLSPFLRGESKDVFKRETMKALIQSEWVEQEATAQGITISDEEVEREWDERTSSSPEDEKARRQVLEDSGLTEDDLRYRARVDRLREKLEQAIGAKAPKVSDEDIAAYYEKNKQRFFRPERRDFIFVLTKAKAKADRARQALEDGESWKSVVKRYSTDPTNSMAAAIRGPKLAEGREALERAIYRTGKGEIDGPVKTRFGWYVFEVTNVRPALQHPLADVKRTISTLLQGRRRVAAVEEFYDDYRSKTVCADEFKVPECSNGPKEKSS
jgi:foldase protein PrsA